MKSLITKSLKHLLYKDELGDQFLLLKYGEVFRYCENTLRIHTWNVQKARSVAKFPSVTELLTTNDPLYCFRIKNVYLPDLIALGVHRRRVHKNGNWISKVKEKLGHDIIHYNPVWENNERGQTWQYK